ncbi:hypothetical protein BHE74_00038481 [Ensete ventricosum]|nr:hypothetical protein GW17_00034878 [Ensete ventricosum]RWW54916.1 hypothetical protein BHE74_00038481 [Ensete ventricosum]RZS07103.1 hypothetical protein BHM03_00037889 [Ensete ventricosum]
MDPSSTPPKLSLYWLPSQRREPPGMATPPPGLPVSVPFLWEEAPGKPRKQPTLGAGAIRSLDLPPRLLAAAEIKSDKTSSPTTVLDGPERSSRAMPLGSCYSFSFGEGRTVVNMRGRKKEGVAWFWRRGSGRKVTREGDSWEMSLGGLTEKGVACSSMPSSSSSFSSSCKLGGDCEGGVVEEGKVRITRLRRNRSIASKHLWQLEEGVADGREKGPQGLK